MLGVVVRQLPRVTTAQLTVWSQQQTGGEEAGLLVAVACLRSPSLILMLVSCWCQKVSEVSTVNACAAAAKLDLIAVMVEGIL
jgi:hypothetical protein